MCFGCQLEVSSTLSSTIVATLDDCGGLTALFQPHLDRMDHDGRPISAPSARCVVPQIVFRKTERATSLGGLHCDDINTVCRPEIIVHMPSSFKAAGTRKTAPARVLKARDCDHWQQTACQPFQI